MILANKQTHCASEPRARRESKLRSRFRRGLFRMLLVFCVALAHGFAPTPAVGQESAGEYELKAAMFYNLTRFVEWPPSAYADPQAPTALCILGRDPFGESLTSLIAGRVENGRPLVIRHLRNDKETAACQVLYISSSEKKNIASIFKSLRGACVLTVGEMAEFAARGGMIQFSLEEKQVRLEINLEAASEADIRISSRLLVLARIVKEQNRNSGKEGSALRVLEFEVASAPPAEGRSGPGWNAADAAIFDDESDEFRRSG